MTISPDTLLGNSFVISIPGNEAQLSRFNYLFRRAFPGVKLPRLYRGFKNRGLGGNYNCSLSHAGVVRMAKALDMPFVCIFEDDAYPCIDAESALAEVLHAVPDDAGVLVLGYLSRTDTLVDDADRVPHSAAIRFMRSGNTWGTHAYVVFSGFYDRFISACEEHVNLGPDAFVEKYREVAVSEKCLFIQFNLGSSEGIHKHSGYSGAGRVNTASPPPGFEDYDKMTENAFNDWMGGHTSFLKPKTKEETK